MLTEGEVDCAVALQCGFLGISVGAAPAKASDDPFAEGKYSHLAILRRIRNPIILAVDGDKAGENLQKDLIALLGEHRCKKVSYPEKCKDLNDVLSRHQPQGVKGVLNNSRYVRVLGIYTLDELPPEPPTVAYDAGLDGLTGKLN